MSSWLFPADFVEDFLSFASILAERCGHRFIVGNEEAKSCSVFIEPDPGHCRIFVVLIGEMLLGKLACQKLEKGFGGIRVRCALDHARGSKVEVRTAVALVRPDPADVVDA